MKQGDFTQLAKEYIHRTGYSHALLKVLSKHIGAYEKSSFVVADVGAGTGKLTENLIELNLRGYAVEPNDAMREEAIRLIGHAPSFKWSKGSGETTGLADSSIDWILMGSSFHWTDQSQALKEFYRILKPGGFFTALWNPRHLEGHSLHKKIEERIYATAPHIQRVSSGSSKYTQNLEKTLLSSGQFKNLIFIEAPHIVEMTPERYLGAWRSVNDIQAQVGSDKFQEILIAIQEEIEGLEKIDVPYLTRAWTVQSTKHPSNDTIWNES